MFSEPRMSKLNNWDLEGVEDKQQGQDKPKKNLILKGLWTYFQVTLHARITMPDLQWYP